jgi:hypothetical protein
MDERTVLAQIDIQIKNARGESADAEADTPGNRIVIETTRPTGKHPNNIAYELLGLGAIAAGGAMTLVPPAAPFAPATLAAGSGIVFGSVAGEQREIYERKTFTLNEAQETFRQNQEKLAQLRADATAGPLDENRRIRDTKELVDQQNVVLDKNRAIILGIADAWSKFQTQIAGFRQRNGGVLGNSSGERDALRNLQATEEALRDIGIAAKDPETRDLLAMLQRIMSGSAPSGPFFGEGGEPQAGGRVMPLSLGQRSELGGGSGDDVLVGGAGTDTLGRSMQQFGGNAEIVAQGFAKLNAQAKRFEALTGPLATGLAETNTLFVSQADRLRGLGALLPDIGRQLIDVFDSGTVGAERLDSAVQAVGKRFLDAFEGAILRGESLGDVLKSLARDLANLALNEVKTGGIDGIFDILGGLFTGGISATAAPAAASSATSLIWTAKGNAFTNGRLTALAKGGAFTSSIVDRPTLFPMADGAGLMGEDGPEAVLPLTRLANGELGVKGLPAGPAAAASGPVYITINAPGADRGALQGLTRELRRQGEYLRWLDRTMDRRAVEAVVYTRGRGGNIARAFGGW